MTTIFHFAGHGNDKGLVFEEADGTSSIVPPSKLGAVLKNNVVQLSVFTACDSAMHGQAVTDMLQYAIGMEGENTWRTSFTRELYGALGAGQDIEMGFRNGADATTFVHNEESSSRGDSMLQWRFGEVKR